LVRGGAGVWNLSYQFMMEERQLKETLQRLAQNVVKNEMVCECLLTEPVPISQDNVGEKMREMNT
jgi:hypothetical protein